MGLQITRNGPDSEPDYEICIRMTKFVRWSAAKGIMGATIAMLSSYGWAPAAPHMWADPKGRLWTIVDEKDIIAVVDIARDLLKERLWEKASQHYQGGGLEHGADWQATTQYIGWLAKKKEGRLAEHALLETMLAGPVGLS